MISKSAKVGGEGGKKKGKNKIKCSKARKSALNAYKRVPKTARYVFS